MSLPGQFEVGDLYLGEFRNGLKVWSQPVKGGPVYPQLPTIFPQQDMGFPQTPMAYPAMYYFSCGHPLNCCEVYQYFDPYDEEDKALICCPMCSFIQQILPLAVYQSYVDTPLVVA